MKAKEYVLKFQEFRDKFKGEHPDDGELDIRAGLEVVSLLFEELESLSKARNAKTAGVYVAIVKELRLKWKSIVRLINNPVVREDYFDDLYKASLPETASIENKLSVFTSMNRSRR